MYSRSLFVWVVVGGFFGDGLYFAISKVYERRINGSHRQRSYQLTFASNPPCSAFPNSTYYSYLKKTLYAGNVRVLAICILARYLSGLWLVAFLGTVYILLLVKSMRDVLTALIDREVTSLPSPQIHLVPHSQTQHSCHAIWRFAGQSIAQVHCR